ncbi:MAG: siderophore-interacting protein, partial [Actinobacteria bacterium]|nr:siderophore-interacting protein [Actinomycetota bacterium]
AGDEAAIPAISQLLEALPRETPVQVHIEAAQPEATVSLPDHPAASVTWWDQERGAAAGEALVAALRGAELPPGTRVWVAGEAAAVQRIRRHLFEERGVPRSHATVRGYWKHGGSGDAEEDPRQD